MYIEPRFEAASNLEPALKLMFYCHSNWPLAMGTHPLRQIRETVPVAIGKHPHHNWVFPKLDQFSIETYIETHVL